MMKKLVWAKAWKSVLTGMLRKNGLFILFKYEHIPMWLLCYPNIHCVLFFSRYCSRCSTRYDSCQILQAQTRWTKEAIYLYITLATLSRSNGLRHRYMAVMWGILLSWSTLKIKSYVISPLLDWFLSIKNSVDKFSHRNVWTLLGEICRRQKIGCIVSLLWIRICVILHKNVLIV